MTSKHTPGPWRVVGGTQVTGRDVICNTADLDDPRQSNEAWVAEMQANARLIAAAPDLADALRAALAFMQSLPLDLPDGSDESRRDLVNAMFAARAALNKLES